MGRKKLGDRLIGIEDRKVGEKRWRVHFIRDGKRIARSFASASEARSAAKEYEELTARVNTESVSATMASYSAAMVREHRWDPNAFAFKTKLSRLRIFFAPVLEHPIGTLTAEKIDLCIASHDTEARPAYGTRAEAREKASAFLSWCVREGLLKKHPFAERHKMRWRDRPKRILALRIDEARALRAVVEPAARGGSTSAAFVLTCLIVGLRTTECTGLTLDSFDDDGSILVYTDAKTKVENRTRIPRVIQEILAVRRALAIRRGEVQLFPDRRDSWGAEVTRRWAARAGLRAERVAIMDARWLRRTKDSLGVAGGLSLELVAAETHHTPDVALRHYVEPGAIAAGRARNLDSATAPKSRPINPPELIVTAAENGSVSISTGTVRLKLVK